MAEIDDWDNIARVKLTERLVGEVPVVSALAEPCSVDRRTVAQVADVEIVQEIEVSAPVLVMAALFHFVDPYAPAINGGIAVLDSRCKHEDRSRHCEPFDRCQETFPERSGQA